MLPQHVAVSSLSRTLKGGVPQPSVGGPISQAWLLAAVTKRIDFTFPLQFATTAAPLSTIAAASAPGMWRK